MPTRFLSLSCALVILLGYLLIAAQPALSEPNKVIGARPGDCAACHGSTKVLPEGHPDTADMTLGDCRGCHEKSGATSLRTRLPLFHLHQLAGTTCAKCHEDPTKAEDVGAERCKACHDVDKLAEATAQVKPQNPHVSKHWGKNADCNLCHHQHEKSEDYCATCHSFKFVVP